MTVRARYGIDFTISSTVAEERDLGNFTCEVVNDISAEGGTRKTKLLAGAIDTSLVINQIANAKLLLIRTASNVPTNVLGTVTVKLNSIENTAISIIPLSGASEGHFLLSTSGLSDIFVSNPGTTDVLVTVMVIGD